MTTEKVGKFSDASASLHAEHRYLPTPAEIRRACAAIRSEWTEVERQLRRRIRVAAR